MDGSRIRRKRIAAGIPGSLLCIRAKISRSRLSDLERGYIAGATDEFLRIERTLDELIEARRKVEQVAAEVGWPMSLSAE
jgi:transcriptional regulator with XRE-family HTH domain